MPATSKLQYRYAQYVAHNPNASAKKKQWANELISAQSGEPIGSLPERAAKSTKYPRFGSKR